MVLVALMGVGFVGGVGDWFRGELGKWRRGLRRLKEVGEEVREMREAGVPPSVIALRAREMFRRGPR